ncbi:hypothetical protein ACWEJ6_11385 [Nonomuraea sp. NPDC004702]
MPESVLLAVSYMESRWDCTAAGPVRRAGSAPRTSPTAPCCAPRGITTSTGKRTRAAARAATGQRYVVADRQGEWTAIWYLGQKAWFHSPESGPVAVPGRARTATPRPGLDAVPVYGRAYPEEAAYPPDVEVQPLVPLRYTFPAGQAYTVGLTATGEYYRATTFDTTQHRVVRGTQGYHQIQFGHRVMFVRSEDVVVTDA